jgi:hypothetical protein
VRDIELTEAQQLALLEQNSAYNRQLSGWTQLAARRRAEREAFQQEGRRRARANEPGFIAGCMLYWAEGSKKRNQLQFTNSDPAMARFFVDFLKTYFDLAPEQIRITCHLYADHLDKQVAIERHWLETLGLPSESLRKSVVNVYSLGNLPYGTCRVVVSRTWVTQTIFGAIQEIGGFARPSWLE